MADDVVVQKLASIDRCLASVRRYVAGELAIDAACREVSRRRLGVPADSGDAFPILEREGILSAAVAEPMRRMVGVRNVAVHEYRRLDPDIVRTVVERRRGDFGTLCREPLAA